jgi:hypothetical protein
MSKTTVDTTHKKYASMNDQWFKCRAVASGQKAVHAAGETFLPKLKDQTAEDYKSYKLRASFFNASWRTISALSGLIFRKPPVVDVAKSTEPMLEDVTMSGIDFQVFAQQTAIEILTTGRIGILVDFPSQSTEGMTQADAEAEKIRPTMQKYQAESIINWKTARMGNETALFMVVLREDVTLKPENEFEHKTEVRYRVLDLARRKLEDKASENEGIVYRVRVFRIEDKEQQQVGSDLFPLMNGKPLTYIPFYFIGVDDTTPDVDEPPLIDLVDLNLAHYRTGADYAHGLHFTGLPTAVVSGYSPEDKADKLYIGSQSAWTFPDPQAKATFLEFTGQGLQALEKALEKMEQQMAILGARLLTAEKKDAETAQVAQIHRAGESSVLSAIAQTISIGLTKALNMFCEWAGQPGKWSVSLNRDFLPVGMTPQELTALLVGWQMGAPGLSDEGLFNIFKQREMINDDITLEDEQTRIGSKRPPAPGDVSD